MALQCVIYLIEVFVENLKLSVQMGGFFSQAIGNIRHKYFSKSMHIIMTGLDSAGKTTILYKLKMERFPQYMPIIGYQVETVDYRNVKFSTFDVGGQNKQAIEYSRDFLCKNYYHTQNISALIWVIDSTDKERIALDINTQQTDNKTSSKTELDFILNQKELKDIVLLIFVNKTDLAIMDLNEVLQKLDISTIKQNWFAIQTTATSGYNLYEGLDWLSNTLQKTNKSPVFEVENSDNNNNTECVTWFCKEKHNMIFENRKKSILFVSGWIRVIDRKYKLTISCDITKLVHQFYQDTKVPFNAYKYYG
eukprot:194183_1